MENEICTISSLYTVCGGAIKVIGKNNGISDIGTNVRVAENNNHFFYASVIEISITNKTIEITLDNFGKNVLKKEMKIYLNNL